MDQNIHGALEDDNLDELNADGLIGVIKIKDGLFICDELGAQDLEFVVANKVTRVINCAGTQLRNFWEAIGIMYLTLNWQDDEKQTLFDSAEKIPEEIYRFMEEAVDNHESVMIQSVRAQNRACFVVATFLMRRYKWSLLKTLEFLNSRRPDLEMRPSFLAQLQQHEGRLYARGIGPKTKRWNELAETNVPDLENDELILRNTFMNSQQGPLVDLNPPPGIHPPKQDRLVWRDLAKYRQQQALCEENQDEEDLINLNNPPKQMNHRQKPASQLKSRLKNSKLHAAQRRQEQSGNSQLSQNFMHDKTSSNPVIPPRANSANSKSKFLTKTQHNPSQSVSQGKVENRPASEQQNVRSNSIRNSNNAAFAPSPNAVAQSHPNYEKGHQPATGHMQSSLFYPQPSFQQQKQATLQQKVLSQRPGSHQVREVSPLNSSNLNSRVTRPTAGGASIVGGSTTQSRSGHSNQQNASQGNYVPYEPKKREMTQKIAPKLPMTQDLTNLPLPHTHMNQFATSEKQATHAGKQNQYSQNQNTGPSKMLDRPRSSQVSGNSGLQSTSHQAKTSTMSHAGGRTGGQNHQATRGISPSFQAKTGDLGARNRTTLNSSFKRTAMTAHPPAHPNSNGISMGPGQDSHNHAARPGSAPKMRTHTPNGEATATSSLILKSQPSTQSTAGGLNSSMSLSKQVEGNATSGQSSKNMLNSFRNGPIKVIGSASHLSSGPGAHAHKPRVSSSKFVSSSSQPTGGANRPASAPNKRPPSPSTSNSQNNAATGAGSSTTHNRVKYSKGLTSGLHNKNGSGGSGSHSTTQGPNQLRQGLNPMLRGYSPSKHRWKIATAANGVTAAGRQNGSHSSGYGPGSSVNHGHSGSNFGGTNPNVYTRSTKHTPAHTSKV